jgi:putative endonuclease
MARNYWKGKILRVVSSIRQPTDYPWSKIKPRLKNWGFLVLNGVKLLYKVYVLYSETFEKIYIGQTIDIQGRLAEHNVGLSTYTKKFIPWKLVYTETLATRAESLKREKQLKTSRGRSFIWREIIGKEKY